MDDITKEDILAQMLKLYFHQVNETKIIEKSVEKEARHFTSGITYLTMEFKQKQKLYSENFVLKTPNPSTMSFFERLTFFSREFRMYRTMIPHINKFLDSSLLPKGQCIENTQLLLLENLTEQGYKSLENIQVLGLQQCKPILKALAHFHAASHKACEIQPDIFEETLFHTWSVLDAKYGVGDYWWPVVSRILDKKMSHLNTKFTTMTRYLEKDNSYFHEKMHHSNFQFVVLNHGDFRKENLMVKFGANEAEMTAIKIIDFQACAWSTPLLDLIYFFITSAQPDVLDSHFETLVDWYLRCLKEKLQQLGSKSAYEKADFMIEMKNLSFLTAACLLMSTMYLGKMDDAQLMEMFSSTNKTKNSSIKDVENGFLELIVSNRLQFCHKFGLLDAAENNTAETESYRGKK